MEVMHCKEVLVSLDLLSRKFSHWLLKKPSLLDGVFQQLA